MNAHHNLIRLLPALLLFCSDGFCQDTSFQTKGFFISNNPNLITTAAVQPDGKVIVSGDFSFVEEQPTTIVVRLLPNGSRDTSFDSTIGTNGTIEKIIVQSDGKIIFGGVFSSYRQQSLNAGLVRINTNGSIDNSFVPYRPLYNYSGLTAAAVQPDGKILLSGFGINTNGAAKTGIIRLNANGTIDNTFSMQGLIDDLGSILTIKVLHNGKIIVAGYFVTWNGVSHTGIIRLNSDGSIDSGFQLTGNGLQPYFAGNSTGVWSVIEYPDSTLLVGGNFIYYNGTLSPGVVKLLSNGSLDTSFHMDPTFNVNSNFSAQCLAVTPQNKILVGGHFYIPGPAPGIYKDAFLLQQNGSLDSTAILSGPDMNKTFTAGGLSYIFPNNDGSFLGLGDYSGYYDSAFVNNISLYTATLHHDPSFVNTFLQKGLVNETIIQPDGKYLVNGNFSLYDTNYNNQRGYIARLLPDGNLDDSFANIDVNGPVNAFTLQDDGKIIGAGNFSSVGSISKKGVARFLSDGSLDASFDPGTGPNPSNSIYCLYIQNNQYLYLGGGFSSFNGLPRQGIVRLLMDGSVDQTFNAGSSPLYAPTSIVTTSDGKILAAESSDVTTRDYNTPLRLYRLLDNGLPDNSFQTPVLGWSIGKKIRIGLNNTIYWLGDLIQSSSPNNFKQTIVRLKQDGSLDSSAKVLPDNYVVSDFTILPDSNLLVTGQIIYAGLDSTFFVMHLKPDLSIDSSFNPISVYYSIKNINFDNDGRIVVAGEPLRYLRIQNDQVQNIGVFNSTSMVVYDNTRNQRDLVSNIVDTLSLAQSANVGNNVEEQFTLRNISSSLVSLLDPAKVLISGTNANEFHSSFVNNSVTISKNDSITFKLTFSPSSVGDKTIKISIPYSNGLDNMYSFTLKATATNIATPVTNINRGNSIQIYPNPVVANNKVYIKSSLKFQTYVILDQYGRIVQQGGINNGNVGLTDISIGRQIQSGIYILKLMNSKDDLPLKILIRN